MEKAWLLTVFYTDLYDSDPEVIGIFSSAIEAREFVDTITPGVRWYAYINSYDGSLPERSVGINAWRIEKRVLNEVDSIKIKTLHIAAAKLS